MIILRGAKRVFSPRGSHMQRKLASRVSIDQTNERTKQPAVRVAKAWAVAVALLAAGTSTMAGLAAASEVGVRAGYEAWIGTWGNALRAMAIGVHGWYNPGL